MQVIRHAELQNDRAFLQQLAASLKSQTKLKMRVRSVHQLYIFVIFFLEALGMSLPTYSDLWDAIDPHQLGYKSLPAFERDFQRRRIQFGEILSAGDALYL
jgi:hypothetical protein